MLPMIDLNAYNPETVRAYEVGFKNRFLNNHLQFNVSGFWENYTGQQVSQIDLKVVSLPVFSSGRQCFFR